MEETILCTEMQWCTPWPWYLSSRLPWGTLLPCLDQFSKCLALALEKCPDLGKMPWLYHFSSPWPWFFGSRLPWGTLLPWLDQFSKCLALPLNKCLGLALRKMSWLHHWWNVSGSKSKFIFPNIDITYMFSLNNIQL